MRIIAVAAPALAQSPSTKSEHWRRLDGVAAMFAEITVAGVPKTAAKLIALLEKHTRYGSAGGSAGSSRQPAWKRIPEAQVTLAGSLLMTCGVLAAGVPRKRDDAGAGLNSGSTHSGRIGGGEQSWEHQ